MANIAGIYVVQQEGTLIAKREYKINTFILTNEQIRTLKEECRKCSQSSLFKLPSDLVLNGENVYSVCYFKRNDLFFIAVSIDDQFVTGEAMSTLQILRLIMDVTEETIGLDKMRENFYSVTLVIDTMVDYGMPLITEKSVLVNMLQKTDIISKATNALAGQVSDKHSNALLNALNQINNNANALWRYNTSGQSEAMAGEKGESTSGFIKDLYVDHVEYCECIFNEQGEQEMQEVTGEVQVDAQLPGSKARASVKLRFSQDIEDYVIHKHSDSRTLQTIGNHEFTVSSFTPPHGKFTLLKYINKPFPISMPFNLKCTYTLQSGVCSLNCRFERYSMGKTPEGQHLYPAMEQIFVRFYFPEETIGASLSSINEGLFNYDEKENIGEWTINQFPAGNESVIRLTGNIKFNDASINEMPGSIVATVNCKIKDFTFSGSKIEKITCNLSGGPASKDDSSVFKGVKTYAFAKNIEFRF